MPWLEQANMPPAAKLQEVATEPRGKHSCCSSPMSLIWLVRQWQDRSNNGDGVWEWWTGRAKVVPLWALGAVQDVGPAKLTISKAPLITPHKMLQYWSSWNSLGSSTNSVSGLSVNICDRVKGQQKVFWARAWGRTQYTTGSYLSTKLERKCHLTRNVSETVGTLHYTHQAAFTAIWSPFWDSALHAKEHEESLH